MFYSVIETRDFSLFNQSAQALLKGYFINEYMDQDQGHFNIQGGTGGENKPAKNTKSINGK